MINGNTPIALAFLMLFGTLSASALSPTLECVRVSSPDECTAVYGYNNPPNDFVPFEPIGTRNRFSPDPQDRGQPENFAADRQFCVFTVDFDCNNLVWNLDGRTSVANGNTPQNFCPANCFSCGPFGDEVVVEPFSGESGEEACVPPSVENVEITSGTFSGCTLNNIIGTCRLESETEAEYEACIIEATNELLLAGDISTRDAREIDFCATGVITRDIPTLSQWGMIAIAAVLGIAGFIAIRRRAAAQ